jgi:uncharacterized OsmC-like protein
MVQSTNEPFALELVLEHDYQFTVRFDHEQVPPLTVDESPPLGKDRGPNPVRVLAAAVGHCLGASLLFCLRRSRVEVQGMQISVAGTVVRNARGRLRIGSLHVTLAPEVAAAQRERMGRCLELFEDFCIVTESVRQGIPVTVVLASDPADATAPAVDAQLNSVA